MIPPIVINYYPEDIYHLIRQLRSCETASINVACSTPENKESILLWIKNAGCYGALSEDERTIFIKRQASPAKQAQWVKLYACSKCKTISVEPLSECPRCHTQMEVL